MTKNYRTFVVLHITNVLSLPPNLILRKSESNRRTRKYKTESGSVRRRAHGIVPTGGKWRYIVDQRSRRAVSSGEGNNVVSHRER